MVVATIGVLPERAAGSDHWYVPDHAKVQFAGWMGFLSPGAGYSWFGRRLEADLFFGWVPRSVGGEDIVSLTGKLTYLGLRLEASDGITVHPLTVSAQLTWTHGSEYWIREPDHYPTHPYYPLPTALRAGVGVGGDIGRPLWGLERVSAYYELVALDLMLGYWLGNRDSLDLSRVFSLAAGVRIEL